jgi:hypothetical protein
LAQFVHIAVQFRLAAFAEEPTNHQKHFWENLVMRTFTLAVALLFTAAIAQAEDKTVAFPPKDSVMNLTVPKDAKVTTDAGKTTIDTPKGNVYLWVAADAKTIDDAVKGIGKIVESEVKEIKVSETKSIKVADNDAKQITAKTKEADDGDDGTSAFVVFKFGGKVIVACVHGENDAAARQLPWLLEVLGTVKAP